MRGNRSGIQFTRLRTSPGRLGRRLAACGVVAALLALAVPTSAAAAPAYLLIRSAAEPEGALVPFDTDNPTAANLGAAVPITGTGSERVLAIDSRASNGRLYGMTEASRLYTIDPRTGSATQVGEPGLIRLDPFIGVFQGLGFDFDPAADLLRVTEDDGLVNGQDDNFLVDPHTGLFTQQSDLGGPATDVDIAGVAYTNNAPGASSTNLYGIETNQPVMGNSRLVLINPPAAGTLTTIDSNGNGLGVAVDSQNMGFDISDANRAFAALSVGGVFGMYRVDLDGADGGNGTGDATLIGVLGSPGAQGSIAGFAVRGFALAAQADLSADVVAPNAVRDGERFSYTVTARNGGPATAHAAVLRVRLSPGQRFFAASAGCSYDGSNRTVSCPLGDIANGASRSRRVTVEATRPGTVSARATVSSATADPRPVNDSETEEVNVRSRASAPGCTITGDPGGDILRGTRRNDVICGGGGNDIIYGFGGNDILRGGEGNDILRGGKGNDRLSGGPGNDQMQGGPGDDSFSGGPGRDTGSD